MVAQCSPLAQNECKKVRNDKIAAMIRLRYEHYVNKESRVLENEEVKILQDFTIQTGR